MFDAIRGTLLLLSLLLATGKALASSATRRLNAEMTGSVVNRGSERLPRYCLVDQLPEFVDRSIPFIR